MREVTLCIFKEVSEAVWLPMDPVTMLQRHQSPTLPTLECHPILAKLCRVGDMTAQGAA